MTTFHSTRSTTDSLTSKQAIRKGIADDGGLFVTDSLGETHVDIASLAGKSYQQIAFDVLSVLLPDYTEAELKECIDEAYGPQWSDEKITPVKPLGDDYVMELFNGPTSAFKDVALQILPRFMARTTPADGDADEKIMIVRRPRQGRVGWFRGRRGHRHHRVLSGRQGQPGAGAADDHAVRLQCERVRGQGQFR